MGSVLLFMEKYPSPSRKNVPLKVVDNEKVGGSGMCQTVPIWLGPGDRSSFLYEFCCRL
jgi:hypothetical protein